MATYKNKDIYLARATGTAFEEAPLIVQPNSIVVTDAANNLVMTASSAVGGNSQTASYAVLAAYANNALTSDFSLLAGSAIDTITAVSASWATQSLFAVSASWATQSLFADQSTFATQSTFAVSASWATQSLFADQSTFATQSTFAVSASWATQSLFADQSTFATQSTFAVSASWATQSLFAVSASWATQSLFADQSTFATQSTFAVSASWATQSLFADQSIFATQSLFAFNIRGVVTNVNYTNTMSINFDTSLFHTSSISGDLYLTASNISSGKMTSIKLVETGGTNCNLYYPQSWVWLGTAPTIISASKLAVVSIVAFGNNDSDIIGTFAMQN